MTDFRFESVCGPVDAALSVPGSKSITNRALILSALADGVSVLRSILLADDTWLMIEALRGLGIGITIDEDSSTAEVTGCRGLIPVDEAELYCGNSGTTIRFCTALCALSHAGTYRLDGIARMRRRPIGPLTDALSVLGTGIEFEADAGFPPLAVYAGGLRGGHVAFTSPASSQFVSALLMIAPYALADMLVEVFGDAPSVPFLRMTTAMMEQFGVPILSDGLSPTHPSNPIRLVVEAPQTYRARAYSVEPDATNAMYFLSIPAVAGGRFTVADLGSKSLQGDVDFLRVLERLGCHIDIAIDRITVSRQTTGALRAIDIDLNAMPDMVPTLAVLALFADGPTTIRNAANLRIKETDRLAALRTELTRVGAAVEELSDGLRITPPARLTPVTIATYDDHRMAMSFALAGLRCPGLTIENIECTAKSFPGFFDEFAALAR